MPAKKVKKIDEKTLQRMLESPTNLGSEVIGTQIRQWLESALHFTREIVRDRERSLEQTVGVFWIRLYGILHDLRKRFEDWHEVETKVRAIRHPLAEQYVKTYMPTEPGGLRIPLKLIDSIVQLFNQDELAYIEYRRDVEAHPFQLGYQVGFRKDGSPSLSRKCHLPKDREIGREVVDRMLRGVIRKYGHEVWIAIDFAERCVSKLEELGAWSKRLRVAAVPPRTWRGQAGA